MDLYFSILDTFSYFYSAKDSLIKLTINFLRHIPSADKWLVAAYHIGHSKYEPSTINLRVSRAGWLRQLSEGVFTEQNDGYGF